MRILSIPKMHGARGAETPLINRHGEAGHASSASMAGMAVILVVVMLGAVGCQKSSTGGGIFSKITDSLSGQPAEIDARQRCLIRSREKFRPCGAQAGGEAD